MYYNTFVIPWEIENILAECNAIAVCLFTSRMFMLIFSFDPTSLVRMLSSFYMGKTLGAGRNRSPFGVDLNICRLCFVPFKLVKETKS